MHAMHTTLPAMLLHLYEVRSLGCGRQALGVRRRGSVFGVRFSNIVAPIYKGRESRFRQLWAGQIGHILTDRSDLARMRKCGKMDCGTRNRTGLWGVRRVGMSGNFRLRTEPEECHDSGVDRHEAARRP